VDRGARAGDVILGCEVIFPGPVEELALMTPVHAWTVVGKARFRAWYYDAIRTVIVPVHHSLVNTYLRESGRPRFPTREEATRQGEQRYGLPRVPFIGEVSDDIAWGVLQAMRPAPVGALKRVDEAFAESPRRREWLLELLCVNELPGPYPTIPLTARVYHRFRRGPVAIIEVYRCFYYAYVDGIGAWPLHGGLAWDLLPPEVHAAARMRQRGLDKDEVTAILEVAR